MKMMKIVWTAILHRQIESVNMEKLDTQTQFTHYPYALCASDMKIQQSKRSSWSNAEAKDYFSQKHTLYGYKTGFSALFAGILVNFTNHVGGLQSDIKIFRKYLRAHRKMLQKTPGDEIARDNGELWERFPKKWSIRVDNSYQGFFKDIGAIIPMKKRREGVYQEKT